jgi:hypothetical protein
MTLLETNLSLSQVTFSQNIMEATGGMYKVEDKLLEDLQQMKRFGHVSRQYGEYVFEHCSTCHGPMLGQHDV